jgi:hypothetical protein
MRGESIRGESIRGVFMRGDVREDSVKKGVDVELQPAGGACNAG